ncbi:MAG: MYG1 family protein [Weeksellaceae bacterium]
MRIGTHNGLFHADDVFAVATLLLVYPGAEVVRTRNPDLLDTCDIVVDVGGVYDPEKGRFDHHQRPQEGEKYGAGQRGADPEEGEWPYAAFGLVWKEEGVNAIHAILTSRGYEDVPLHVIENMALTIDESFVRGIDASDNGVKVASKEATTISHIISGFNPNMWAEDPEAFDGHFNKVLPFAALLLEKEILRTFESSWINQKKFEAAMDDTSPEGVVVLNEYVAFSTFDIPQEVLYVVYPSAGGGGWMVQQVPKEPGSFEGRKPLPEAWKGLRGQELADKLEISVGESLPFCHNGLFIGGAVHKDEAIKMAMIAVKA